MSKTKLSKKELQEIKKYVKEQSKKLKAEGSTTAGVPGYQTPAAFTGEEGGKGAKTTDFEQGQFAYSIKASDKKKHFIKLAEVSYKAFKQDTNANEIQKVNRRILEVNKMLREISRALDHSIKLKTESSLDNSKYWKRTNEAILKINERLAEVTKKARTLANLKELAANNAQKELEKLFVAAGIEVEDIGYNETGKDHYEFDVTMKSDPGEPYAFDYVNGALVYMGPDDEIELGNMLNQKQLVIQNLQKTFKA